MLRLIKRLFTKTSSTNNKEKDEYHQSDRGLVKVKRGGGIKKQSFSDLVKYSGVRNVYKIPYLFSDYTMKFHLKAWIIVNEITEEFLIENVDLSDDFETLSFNSKEHADEFMTWFEGYAARFASENDLMHNKFPSMKEGYMEGYFCPLLVEDDSDSIVASKPMAQSGLMQKSKSVYARFIELNQKTEEDWIWILKYTQGAIWVENGWLFKDKTDYCAFKLMQQD